MFKTVYVIFNDLKAPQLPLCLLKTAYTVTIISSKFEKYQFWLLKSVSSILF